jgi:hypothetical protein
METEELLSKTKWGILKELARGERSATEIAKKTGQSIANTTVQLKIMEAQGLIRKSKLQENDGKRKAGKPKIPFELNQELGLMGIIAPGVAERKVFKLKEFDDFHKMMVMSYFVVPQEHHYPVLKYLMEAELIKKADLIALVNTTEREAELFIVTEHLQEIREKFSNRSIETPDGKTKKIISWSHNKKEVEEGVSRKEEYFIKLVKNSIPLLDRKGVLEELKMKI